MVKITCHDLYHYIPTWRSSDDFRFPWRTCSYCGSMHQEDVLEVLKNGAKLESADWKYGWPHKFYVKVKNPNPDHLFDISTVYFDPKDSSYEQIEEKKWVKKGKHEYLHGKFYNEHLIDEGTPLELFDVLEKYSGIRFSIKEGKLWYQNAITR